MKLREQVQYPMVGEPETTLSFQTHDLTKYVPALARNTETDISPSATLGRWSYSTGQ